MPSRNKGLVSKSLPIDEKRETKGNETGNGGATKASLLCKTGNGMESKHGNEESFSDALVSNSLPLPVTNIFKRTLSAVERTGVESERVTTAEHPKVKPPVAQKHLAALWRLSAGRISQLVKRGMPLDSVEAAEKWRRKHVEPSRRPWANFVDDDIIQSDLEGLILVNLDEFELNPDDLEELGPFDFD